MAQSAQNLWHVRRDGDPGGGRPVAWPRLIEGIENGIWEETDEVRAGAGTTWQLIGEHPQLEDYVPQRPMFPSRQADDAETDMTPMIDVTFQLIIFFMIAATFTVQKTLDLPAANSEEQTGNTRTTAELEAENVMVQLAADGTVTLGGQAVSLDGLPDALRAAVAEMETTEMVLDAHDDAKHETVVQVLDAAGAAQIEKVMFVSRSAAAEDAFGP